MSGHGETPTEEGEGEAHSEVLSIGMGQAVYDGDGNELGNVRGFDRGGFFVTTREDVEALSVDHARSGHELGEAELMWRCTECGEMGEIDDGIPDNCPNCGTSKEAIMYWTED